MVEAWQSIVGNWEVEKSAIVNRWKLTEEDLEVISGSKQNLQSMLESRYGYSSDEAALQVDNFLICFYQSRRTY